MQKFNKFCALSGAHKRLFIAALLHLPAFWVGLRLFGFYRFNALLTRAAVASPHASAYEEIKAIGSLVNAAAFYSLGTNNCLTRSLYLVWLLRRRGIICDLRIGVRLAGDQLRGHAWVEIAGKPINDAPDTVGRYVEFDLPD